MPPRGEIAHAAPGLALLAALDLIVPGKFLGLRLQQPIRHAYPSAFSGRVSSDSIAASTLILPSSSAATAAEIGMSTERSRAMSSSTGAVKTPSARPPWISTGLLAAAETDAEREIARLRARAGEQEIAEAGQARHGFRLGAISLAEADQLGKAACGERRERAGAEAAPGDDAGGDGQHVLGGAADLDAAHVA